MTNFRGKLRNPGKLISAKVNTLKVLNETVEFDTY